ncbi:MAG: excinuclease ABC subunit UvrC [Oligoflexia bacterium]|nr:excinuclease ABC subunit UvrC [Oligoflexia bacterium]
MDKVKTDRIGKTQQMLLEQAKTLPRKPGCYLMKDRHQKVIYVGKAKDLKSRVSSYFQNGAKTPKTEILVSHIRTFDFLLTETETEAFVLENNLIKKHSPKYNIMMRDDKSYPYVLINNNEPFPRIEYQRRVKRGAKKSVYGPFVHGSNISEVIRILTKSFQLRDCTIREFNSRTKPCLLYQIHQCSAPCVGKIDDRDYKKDLKLATGFFEGKGKKGLDVLTKRMTNAAEVENFEEAAILRDNIQILEEFVEYSKQKNAEIDSKYQDVDILAYHQGEIETDLAIYMVRNGVLLGHKNFHFPTVESIDEIEASLLNYIFQYYSQTHDTLPKAIVHQFNDKNVKLLSEAIKTIGDIKVMKPTKSLQSIAELAKDQAFESQRVRISNEESVYVGLNKLKELLSMKERPRTLECYDVAIFQGSSPTAAQIVFHEGKADKARYRHYHLETREEGNNDFAMMKEVLERRIKSGDLPDVFIADGGKGQVSIFRTVLEEAGIDIPVVGIAKAKNIAGKNAFRKSEVSHSEERLVIPGRSNPYILQKCKSLMKIVVEMRDEAHRFSRRLHHKAESKRTITSWVDQIPNIGPGTKKKILSQMTKTVEELEKFSVDQLMREFSVSKKTALNIFEFLKDSIN